jgi:hypothetical protein
MTKSQRKIYDSYKELNKARDDVEPSDDDTSYIEDVVTNECNQLDKALKTWRAFPAYVSIARVSLIYCM